MDRVRDILGGLEGGRALLFSPGWRRSAQPSPSSRPEGAVVAFGPYNGTYAVLSDACAAGPRRPLGGRSRHAGRRLRPRWPPRCCGSSRPSTRSSDLRHPTLVGPLILGARSSCATTPSRPAQPAAPVPTAPMSWSTPGDEVPLWAFRPRPGVTDRPDPGGRGDLRQDRPDALLSGRSRGDGGLAGDARRTSPCA